MKMAPVPAFPIPTAADQLPTKKFKLPPGFKVETWASGVLDAREIREGANGTIIVSTLFVGNKVYAFPPGKREPKVIIDKLPMAAGIAFDSKGNLYVATNTKIYRYDGIEAKLDKPGEPKVIYDKLPGGNDHSWKFLRIKDDKLYFPIGAPCNICDPGEYAKIYRMNLDGTRHRDRSRPACATRSASTSIRRPATSGSPTTAATGSARSCPTTSSIGST